jgi:hypothetical protein
MESHIESGSQEKGRNIRVSRFLSRLRSSVTIYAIVDEVDPILVDEACIEHGGYCGNRNEMGLTDKIAVCDWRELQPSRRFE